MHGHRGIIRHSVRSLGVGFAVATLLTIGFCLALRGSGWADVGDLLAERPATGFITRPDRWSLPVAFIAGVAGMLALTSSKSASLVGVFFSVTTVPAAAAFALGVAFGDWSDAGRSVLQLAINVAGILLAAVLTLLVLRAVRRRVPRAVPRRLLDTPR